MHSESEMPKYFNISHLGDKEKKLLLTKLWFAKVLDVILDIIFVISAGLHLELFLLK